MTKKINLRKASAIQKEIGNFLQENQIETTVEVPLLVQEANIAIAKSQDTMHKRVTLHLKLNDILFNIRASVSIANNTSGISSLLARTNLIKSQLSLLNKVKKAEPTVVLKVLDSMIVQKTNSTKDSYYSGNSSTLTVGLLTEEFAVEVNKDIIALKRERNKVNESVLALNVKTEIEISDANYQELEVLGIV